MNTLSIYYKGVITMFDYSRAAIAIILEDIKKWSKIFKIVFSIFTLLYLSYSL